MDIYHRIPLFSLSLSIGLVDGLVQRDIRKFQGARESTLLFHRIKRCGAAIFFLPLFAYLAWLSPVSPLIFFHTDGGSFRFMAGVEYSVFQKIYLAGNIR